MAKIMYVRIRSDLDTAEPGLRVNERKPRFLQVPGLIQKIYGRDEAAGEVCGIYVFENDESLAAFPDGELAKTIPAAYGAAEVRREIYDVLFT